MPGSQQIPMPGLSAARGALQSTEHGPFRAFSQAMLSRQPGAGRQTARPEPPATTPGLPSRSGALPGVPGMPAQSYSAPQSYGAPPAVPRGLPARPQGVFGRTPIPLGPSQGQIDQALTTDDVNVADLIAGVNRRTPQGVTSGLPVPPELLSPAGPVEQSLYDLFSQGAGAFQAPQNGFISSLARGEIPAASWAAFQDQQARIQPALFEGLGGARFGSDATRIISEQANQALTNLLVGSQQQSLGAAGLQQSAADNAIQRYLGVGAGLFGSEQGRLGTGYQLLLQDLLRQSGLPPEVQALIALTGATNGQSTGAFQGFSPTGAGIAAGGQILGSAISGIGSQQQPQYAPVATNRSELPPSMGGY